MRFQSVHPDHMGRDYWLDPGDRFDVMYEECNQCDPLGLDDCYCEWLECADVTWVVFGTHTAEPLCMFFAELTEALDFRKSCIEQGAVLDVAAVGGTEYAQINFKRISIR